MSVLRISDWADIGVQVTTTKDSAYEWKSKRTWVIRCVNLRCMRLEHRFTRTENIEEMTNAGLTDIAFRTFETLQAAVGSK